MGNFYRSINSMMKSKSEAIDNFFSDFNDWFWDLKIVSNSIVFLWIFLASLFILFLLSFSFALLLRNIIKSFRFFFFYFCQACSARIFGKNEIEEMLCSVCKYSVNKSSNKSRPNLDKEK